MNADRRTVLARMALVPVALAGIGASQAAEPPAPVCADPASLPFTQKSRRRALGYVEPSGDDKRRCQLCAFFTAAAGNAGCGACQMLSGGPVSAGGLCSSFAARNG